MQRAECVAQNTTGNTGTGSASQERCQVVCIWRQHMHRSIVVCWAPERVVGCVSSWSFVVRSVCPNFQVRGMQSQAPMLGGPCSGNTVVTRDNGYIRVHDRSSVLLCRIPTTPSAAAHSSACIGSAAAESAECPAPASPPLSMTTSDCAGAAATAAATAAAASAAEAGDAAGAAAAAAAGVLLSGQAWLLLVLNRPGCRQLGTTARLRFSRGSHSSHNSIPSATVVPKLANAAASSTQHKP
jgi:hypothetical protein